MCGEWYFFILRSSGDGISWFTVLTHKGSCHFSCNISFSLRHIEIPVSYYCTALFASFILFILKLFLIQLLYMKLLQQFHLCPCWREWIMVILKTSVYKNTALTALCYRLNCRKITLFEVFDQYLLRCYQIFMPVSMEAFYSNDGPSRIDENETHLSSAIWMTLMRGFTVLMNVLPSGLCDKAAITHLNIPLG